MLLPHTSLDSRFYRLFSCQVTPWFGRFVVLGWRIRGSNPRPQACKARALPAELIPQARWMPSARPAAARPGEAGEPVGRSPKTESEAHDVPRDDVNGYERLTENGSRLEARINLQKGGDPTAGSPTVTLLRLHPSYQSLLGRLPPLRVGVPTSGATDSHGVTGGVYKARERIHPGVLIRDY
jgi:hypothetical protein